MTRRAADALAAGRALRRAGQDPEPVVAKTLSIVEMVPLDTAIAVAASGLKAEARRHRAGKAFSFIDGIGLASARSRGLRFLTLDADFDGFADVVRIAR